MHELIVVAGSLVISGLAELVQVNDDPVLFAYVPHCEQVLTISETMPEVVGSVPNYVVDQDTGHIVWARPYDAYPVWERDEDGQWQQTKTGYSTGIPDVTVPNEMLVKWWIEDQNNGCFTDSVTIKATRPVTILVGSKTYVWGGAADFNADGEVNFFDHIDFQIEFELDSMSCDYNQDGELSFFDFLAFQNLFDGDDS